MQKKKEGGGGQKITSNSTWRDKKECNSRRAARPKILAGNSGPTRQLLCHYEVNDTWSRGNWMDFEPAKHFSIESSSAREFATKSPDVGTNSRLQSPLYQFENLWISRDYHKEPWAWNGEIATAHGGFTVESPMHKQKRKWLIFINPRILSLDPLSVPKSEIIQISWHSIVFSQFTGSRWKVWTCQFSPSWSGR